MRIKKTIKKEETVDIDITLPYFSKDSHYYYCVLSDNQTLKIDYREYKTLPPSSGVNTQSDASDALNAEEITQKEFEDIFEKVTDFHADLFESMRDTIRDRKYGINDNVQINGEGEE